MPGADGAASSDSSERQTALSHMKESDEQISKQEKLLMSPSKQDFEKYSRFLKQPGTGLIRLLPREKYDGKLRLRGGGAYYSFVRRDQEYNYGSDIELYNGSFNVGFAGAECGAFVNLGSMPLENVNAHTPGVEFLANCEQEDLRRSRVIHGQDGFDYSSSIPALTNQTYALRSIDPGRWDILVAFELIRQDPDGSVVLRWKKLK